MRRPRSPPAAMKVVTTRISTSARNAIGSRRSRRGAGRPALRLLAASSARSTWARHSATDHGSFFGGRELVGDRGGRAMGETGYRSRRRSPSAREGNRTKTSGTVAAAVRTRKINSATARAIGGSHSQAPSPRNRKEQPHRGGDGGQRGPQPFPEGDPTRLLESANEHGPGRIRLRRIWRMAAVCQSILRSPAILIFTHKTTPENKF